MYCTPEYQCNGERVDLEVTSNQCYISSLVQLPILAVSVCVIYKSLLYVIA